MVNVISRATKQEKRDKAGFGRGFKLENVTVPGQSNVLAEFIGLGSLPAQWAERRRYEMESGALEEPLLYESIYDIEVNPDLPELLSIYKTGKFGVVMQLIVEGGEAKAVSMESSSLTVTQQQYGALLVYSKKLLMYNMLNLASNAERKVGIATNALLNHAHLSLILTQTYAAKNQTPASSSGTTLEEKFIRTLENAVINSRKDTTDPRRGPYDLVINGDNMFMIERILNPVAQQGISLQSSVLGMIQNVIVYDGWSGTQGLKTATYAGTPSGKGYLVDTSHRDDNFISKVKQPLLDVEGNPDVSRFIEKQRVWDIHFGATAQPIKAVEEITWPS